MYHLVFVFIGLITFDGTDSHVLMQFENNVENTNIDPKVSPSVNNRRKFNKRGGDLTDETDSLESVVLALNTGFKQLMSAGKNSPDIVDIIGKALAHFAKNTAEPIYRSKGQYDIKPEIIHFRSDKPSVMFEINSKSIINVLRDLLQSKLVHQYMDKFSKEAAIIFRTLKRDFEKQHKQN